MTNCTPGENQHSPETNIHRLTVRRQKPYMLFCLCLHILINPCTYSPFFAVKYKEIRGGLRLLISFLPSHTFSRHNLYTRKNCLSDIPKTSYRKTHSKHHLPHTRLTKVSQSHTFMFTTITTEKSAA